MRADADVVVVGGGILGCSAGWHLGQAGLDVLVLDRDGVGQGTSAAGAGFVNVWAAGWIPALGDEELELERYGLAFYRELAEQGHEFGFRGNGNLYAATTAEDWETYVEPTAANTEAVPDVRRLTPAEVEQVTGGVMRADAIYGGVLHPGGSQVTAPRAAAAIASSLVTAGGALETRSPVTRLLVDGGRVTGVETPHGRVAAETVVLAAGSWSNALLREHGVWLPQVPLVASRVVTEPLGVPSTMPTLMIRDLTIYAREEQGALLWGWSISAAPHTAFVDADPPDRFVQLPLDGFFELQAIAERASRAIPLLAQAKSSTVAFGVPTYTADLRPLLGAVPAIEGLFVLAGCNEAGVTHGPGFGKLVAELITDGKASLCDVEAFRPDRFGSQYRTGRDVLEAVEELARTYTMIDIRAQGVG